MSNSATILSIETDKRRQTFGPLSFDPSTATLFRGGESVHLRAQVARVLEVFFRHPEVQISREQLVKEVWGDQSANFQPNTLDRVLADLRQALGPTYQVLLRREGRGAYRLTNRDLLVAPHEHEAAPFAPFRQEDLATKNLPLRSEVFVAAAQPLEIKPLFASAARRRMQDRTFHQFFVPGPALNVVPQLLVGLLLDHEEENSADSGAFDNVVARNIELLQQNMRIIVTSRAGSPVEVVIHNARDREGAQAYIHFPDSEFCTCYGRGLLAYDLAETFREEISLAIRPEAGIVWYPETLAESSIDKLEDATRQHLAALPTGLVDDVPKKLLNSPGTPHRSRRSKTQQ